MADARPFKKKFALLALAVTIAAPTLAPEAASARPKRHHHVTYSRDCSGGNGAVGTIGGGVGGAVLGGAVIGGPVATIAGGVGGALLGRHLDKKNTRSRNGCRRR
jgi:outer membrane lipoprotein SlyB